MHEARTLLGVRAFCVRAVRADYCGTGQANTRQDEKINFYDSAGVQRDAATWTPAA